MRLKMRNISIVTSAVLTSTLLFTGCGGGGGGDHESSTSSVTISGKAVDELIVNGVVTAHKNSAAGDVLATGRTDSHGAYTLSVDKFDGVAVVKVECDAQSKLYFPDTNETKDCPTNLQLFSAAPVTSTNTEVKVNVTPASFAMYTLATGGDLEATLDIEKVENARNKISLALGGIDPVATDPVEDATYKSVVKAFHEAAEESNTSTFEIIEKFAEDAADGELGDDNPEVAKLVAEKMKENNVFSPFVEAVENNESYSPPENPAGNEDIAQAKEFFNSLRTQGESLADEGGFFDTEAQNIEAAIDNVTINGDLAAKAVGNVIETVGEAIDGNLTSYTETIVQAGDKSRKITVTKANATTWNYVFTDTQGGNNKQIAEGTLTIPDIDYDDESLIDTFTVLHATFDGTIPATYLKDKEQKTQTFKADIQLTRTKEGAYAEIKNIELSTEDGTKLGISALKAALGYDYNASNEDDPVTPKYIKLETLTLNGALDRNYSATGTLNVTYTQNSTLASNGGVTEIQTTILDGHVGCYGANNYEEYAN